MCFIKYKILYIKLLYLLIRTNSLYNYSNDRHKACNIFARTYCDLWLEEENVGQEIMIQDLTVSCRSLLCYSLLIFSFSNHLKTQKSLKKMKKKVKASQIH